MVYRRSKILLIGAELLLIAGLIFAVWTVAPWSKKPLSFYAHQILATCAGAQFHPSCYDREIPKLMDVISMEEAFDVTRIVQKEDPQYIYCHVLGHNLSYREAEKHPDQWKDIITRCPTTMCNNGCLHGALMRRFNSESLTDAQIDQIKPDLADVCEPRGAWRPTEVERSMCYHALGHLVMYMTSADIPKSATLCAELGKKSDGRSYVQTCTEGVLMTVYQPLEPEDYALVRDIAPEKADVAAFCSRFVGTAYHACRRESWPLYTKELETPQGAESFCSYMGDGNERRICFSTVMNSMTVSLVIDHGRDLTWLGEYCRSLTGSFRSQCYANAASRLMQIDPALGDTARAVCTLADTSEVGKECFEGLAYYGRYSFPAGSKALVDYCNKLPDLWKSSCLTGK